MFVNCLLQFEPECCTRIVQSEVNTTLVVFVPGLKQRVPSSLRVEAKVLVRSERGTKNRHFRKTLSRTLSSNSEGCLEFPFILAIHDSRFSSLTSFAFSESELPTQFNAPLSGSRAGTDSAACSVDSEIKAFVMKSRESFDVVLGVRGFILMAVEEAEGQLACHPALFCG